MAGVDPSGRAFNAAIPVPKDGIEDNSGTIVPAERIVQFAGSGVSLADDPGNGRTVATFTVGATGPQGNPGTAPFTNVLNLSGNPAGVTDWGALINTALTAGTRRFIVPKLSGGYPLQTKINADGISNVTFEGEGATLYPAQTGTLPAAYFVWKGGAGSGMAISMRGCDGPALRDLGVTYDNAAYNGDLVSFDFLVDGVTQSAQIDVERCFFGTARPSAIRTAKSLITLDEAVTARITKSCFSGAISAIRGKEGTHLSDNIDITENSFFNCSLAYITNPDRTWLIDGNTFNKNDGTAGPPAVVDFDVTGGQPTFTFSNNRLWDMDPTVTVGVRVPAAVSTAFLLAYGNWMWAAMKAFDLQGGGIFTIFNNRWVGTFLNTGTVSPIDIGTTAKSYVSIHGNSAPLNLDAQPFVANVLTTHEYVHIDNPGADNVRTLGGQERVSYDFRKVTGRNAFPTIAVHAAAPGITSVSIAGTDAFGWIKIVTSVSGQAAGLLADVTFAAPVVKPAQSGGVNVSLDGTMRTTVPLVVLTPYDVSGVSTAGLSAGVQAYASVTAGTNTGFSVGMNTAPAASKTYTFAYRVVQL